MVEEEGGVFANPLNRKKRLHTHKMVLNTQSFIHASTS